MVRIKTDLGTYSGCVGFSLDDWKASGLHDHRHNNFPYISILVYNVQRTGLFLSVFRPASSSHFVKGSQLLREKKETVEKEERWHHSGCVCTRHFGQHFSLFLPLVQLY